MNSSQNQLAEIVQHLAIRKKLNPLEFFNPIGLQEEIIKEVFYVRSANVIFICGSNRCIRGDSKIYDPVLKKHRRIDQIKTDFHVNAWNGHKIVKANASKPFIKGFENMFRVKLSNGESFVCSAKHRVLTEHGYRDVSSLHCGSRLFLPQSISDIDPSIQYSNDQNFDDITLDFQFGYRSCRHLCDEQPHNDLNSVQDASPSQAYAHERTFYESQMREDGLKYKSVHTRPCQYTFLLSSLDVLCQNVDQFFDILYRSFCKILQSPLTTAIRTALQSISAFFLRISNLICRRKNNLFYGNCYNESLDEPSYVVIIDIVSEKKDYVWDITVPNYDNYLMSGIIHHNSGKTEIGAYIANRWAIQNPKSRIWLCAETFGDSVNLQQRKINTLLPKTDTKYAYYDEVNGFRNKKIIYKNGSKAEFKSYDQKREGFQGDDIDLCINDEEPSLSIVKEQRMRLVDRNGLMIFTMTPLKGITDLIEDLYEGHEVIKSQYAPLVDEDLPRIARKGNVKFFSLWSSENPYINQERLLEEANLMTKTEKKSRMYGIPANSIGKIYPKYNSDIHLVDASIVPNKQICLYHILDPHDRKPWAMQWWVVHITGACYCVYEFPMGRNFNEIEFDTNTYDDYAIIIKNIEKDLARIYGRRVSRRIIDPNFGNKTVQKAERDGDQSHTTPVKELRKRGFYFRDAIDTLEAGHLEVRKYLHWAEKDGQIVVQPKLFVLNECQNTDRHLSKYSRKDTVTSDGDVKDSVKPKEKYKDYADLTRYFCMSNPVYIPRPNRQNKESGKAY